MSIIEWLKQYFKNPDENHNETAPDEVCPMCWGYQQYQGDFVRDMKINHIDLNNIEEKKGWIEAYAAEKLRGIMLEKKESQGHCPSCGNDAKL